MINKAQVFHVNMVELPLMTEAFIPDMNGIICRARTQEQALETQGLSMAEHI